jgi:hypothetical protein
MRFAFAILIIWMLIPCHAQDLVPRNVLIFEQDEVSYPPCEPSIAIDPRNPDRIVAGAVLDHVFRSTDGGLTWKAARLRSRYGVYGDPCVISGARGRFYYFHLSDPAGLGWSDDRILDRMVCQRSRRIGAGWDKGWGVGLNHPKDQDKEWAIYDPIYERLVLTWTQFDAYGSKDERCESNILLSVSEDGKEWSAPVDLSPVPGNCVDNSGTVEGAVPAIYPDGSICVAWSAHGKIYFKRAHLDGDHVEVLAESVPVVSDADWAFEVPGLGRSNGMPVTVCDVSGGEHHGTIYINWADQRNGSDDTDIWMVASHNGGKNWTQPVRVNDDAPGKHQFFTWMAIDQSTGYLYCVFYDRRHHDGVETDVYLATSRDGGKTWINEQISERPFTPSPAVFFGDYNNISAAQGIVRPIWTRYEDGRLSIWTAIIEGVAH